ncbi:DUF2796 domain-containing protein [Aliamphritea ceti]|uniref:DUF2796 domain-containing protein n=1 Tax=Aliamphritea ceti TaxID=1524258 RepID=UPI0021C3DB4B|nr:DUF2796 domain-containing protein [Aliamphritea ceti]
MKMGLQQILIKDVAGKQFSGACSRSASGNQVRRRTSRSLLFSSVLLASSMASVQSQAQSDESYERQLGSHQHGEAHLDVVLEGEQLVLSFLTPAANIVGFEYAPKTEAEKAQVATARKQLLDIESWLELPKAAGCQLLQAEFTESGEEHGDHDEHEDHGDHEDHDEHEGHKGHDDHKAHDDHDDHKAHDYHEEHRAHDDHEEHKAHDDHKHEEHADTHSDWRFEYKLKCSDSQAVTYFDVGLFAKYPALEDIRVQAVGMQQQGLKTLTPANLRFEF